MSAPRLPLAAAVAALLVLATLAGCGQPEPEATPSRLEVTMPGDTPPAARDLATPSASSRRAAPTSSATSSAGAALDPRNRFFGSDRTPTRSPWWSGAWPVMVPYGCTTAPWYSHDARCPGSQGFHHGTDIAMPCGTTVTAGVAGTVLDPATPVRPGTAYGPNPLRVRTTAGGGDVLLGHARRLFVRPGQKVTVGTPLLEVGDLGAPDGCHLHLEVRAPGGDVATATDPAAVLSLSR